MGQAYWSTYEKIIFYFNNQENLEKDNEKGGSYVDYSLSGYKLDNDEKIPDKIYFTNPIFD